MTNFTNVDKKLLNEVFISILDKEPVNSVCQRLGVSINFYNSYRTIIFDALKNMASSFNYSFTDFSDYIDDISGKKSYLSELGAKIKKSEQKLKDMDEQEKRLSGLKKELSIVEKKLENKRQEERTIDKKRTSFERGLDKYGLTLNDFLKLKTDIVPSLSNEKDRLDKEISEQITKLDSLKQYINSLSLDINNCQDELAWLNSELKDKKDDFVKIEKTVVRIMDEKEEYTKKANDAKMQYKKYTEKLDNIKKDVENLDKQKDKIDQELQDYSQKTISEVEKDVSDLKGEKHAYFLDVENLRAIAENQQEVIDANCEKLMKLDNQTDNTADQEDYKDRHDDAENLVLSNLIFWILVPEKIRSECSQEQKPKDFAIQEILRIIQKKRKEQKEDVLCDFLSNLYKKS